MNTHADMHQTVWKSLKFWVVELDCQHKQCRSPNKEVESDFFWLASLDNFLGSHLGTLFSVYSLLE